MTIVRTRIGTNDDGSPHYHHASELPLLFTGKIGGLVELPDGTKYDVTPDVIEVESPEHAGLVSHAIGIRHEDEGHPDHAPTANDPNPVPFVHVCTPDLCAGQARSADDAVASFEARTDVTHPDHDRRVAAIRAAHDVTPEG